MFRKKIITFCATDKDMVDIWPHPKPANRFIPKDYKELSRFHHNNMSEVTVKNCVPFLDAMSAGYILPFEQDYIVNPTEDDFTMIPANRQEDQYGTHDKKQLPESFKKIVGQKAGKFHNKYASWL